MLKHACLMALLALGAAGCGGSEPPPPKRPAPTVFDPLLKQKQAIPAAIEAADQQRAAETRRQIDAAEGAPPPEAPR